jgi:glycine hydroxymethyltransferase
MKADEMKQVGAWILRALKGHDQPDTLQAVRAEIAEFARHFPVPGIE